MGRLPSGEEITDAEFMGRPEDWPQWPYLPVKRAPHETGVMMEGPADTVPAVVYLGNMLEPQALSAHKAIHYASYQDVVDAGWIVD